MERVRFARSEPQLGCPLAVAPPNKCSLFSPLSNLKKKKKNSATMTGVVCGCMFVGRSRYDSGIILLVYYQTN
jgi:hypothetical protein